MIFNTGQQYGNCMIVVENNNLGYSVLEKIISMGYKNVYYSTKNSTEYVEQYVAEGMSNSVPGITTSHKSRPLIIAKLEEFIRSKSIKLKSIRSYNELTTFVWHSGRPQAMQGYNDDLVMAYCIALWLRDTALRLRQKGIDLNKRALSQFQKTSPVIYTGKSNSTDTGWNWNPGDGNQDLTWLI